MPYFVRKREGAVYWYYNDQALMWCDSAEDATAYASEDKAKIVANTLWISLGAVMRTPVDPKAVFLCNDLVTRKGR